jgi:hypothetical protein
VETDGAHAPDQRFTSSLSRRTPSRGTRHRRTRHRRTLHRTTPKITLIAAGSALARERARNAARVKAAAARAAAAQARTARNRQAPATPATPAAARPVTASGSPQQIARGMLGSYGWASSQFSCLQPLWNAKSGWNASASNPSSGAYGIPQALPGIRAAQPGL